VEQSSFPTFPPTVSHVEFSHAQSCPNGASAQPCLSELGGSFGEHRGGRGPTGCGPRDSIEKRDGANASERRATLEEHDSHRAAGWSYKDWQGIVYPASKPKGFQELTCIFEFFDTVEIM